MKLSELKKTILILFIWFGIPSAGMAYSVLTHEALIDAAWDKFLVPLLNQKYKLTPNQLKEAHAYAYGGAVAPDMGYYPFGSKLYTNLVHYVRSGDYVMALLDEAQNANEYAFALGSLCHYYADVYGHHLGVNVSVPIEYPKIKKKFGDLVTYEEDPTSHKRVEFAFDVVQTAKGNYASQSYHDFIGFKVAEPVMDRAFFKIYSLHLNDVFTSFSRAVSTFRWSVKNFFPAITKAAWVTKKSEIKNMAPAISARQFKYRMRRNNYNKEFGRERDKPKFFSYVLATIIRILPKIGPLKALKFKAPGPVAEKLYIRSFDSVEAHYTISINALYSTRLHLVNKDFDTGMDTYMGEYGLTDRSYQDLLLKLQDNKFDSLSIGLKQNIISFFSKPHALQTVKKQGEQNIKDAIEQLQATIAIKKD